MKIRERSNNLTLGVGIAVGLWIGTNTPTEPMSVGLCALAGVVVFGISQLIDLAVEFAARTLYAVFPSLAPPEDKP